VEQNTYPNIDRWTLNNNQSINQPNIEKIKVGRV